MSSEGLNSVKSRSCIGVVRVLVLAGLLFQSYLSLLSYSNSAREGAGAGVVVRVARRASSEFCEAIEDPTLHQQHAPFLGESQSQSTLFFDRDYYLTQPMLERGMVRGKLHAAFVSKLLGSGKLSVLTLGGSFTRGHGCGETETQSELACAWPARLERWWKNYLEPRLPGPGTATSSQWYHKAEHGSGSLQALQRIGVLAHLFQPDLILIDFLVNDVAQKPIEKGTVAFEALLRTIRRILPNTQILLVEAGCPDCVKDTQLWFTRRRIAHHYHIPILDYAAIVDSFNRDHNSTTNTMDRLWPFTPAPLVHRSPFTQLNITWPNFWPPVRTTKVTSAPLNHPPWPVHQYLSDAVAYLLLQLLREQTCGLTPPQLQPHQSYYPSNLLAQYATCTTPLTNYDALQAYYQNNTSPLTPQPHILPFYNSNSNSSSGWTLFEDKQGRPGWISTQQESSIQFPLKLGAQPTIGITYLKSYDLSMASATVTIQSRNDPLTTSTVSLDGHWDQPYSLPHTITFIGRPDAVDGNLLGPVLEKDGYDSWSERWKNIQDHNQIHHYNITITLRTQGKFKLLQVVSC